MLFKRFVLSCLQFYRRWVSPGLPATCRFYPTCSAYTTQCIEKYGIITGSFLAFKRIIRCHPLNPGGYDPVP